MKKIISLILVFAFIFAFVGCSGAPAAKDNYKVGICQLVQHEALDAATKGFKEALTEKLGDKVQFIEQNASGDSATCITICNQFVSEGVDLMMANATAALQAAAAASNTIPVVGTSITDYATALEISDWTGKTGSNITGTADLAPLDQQAQMLKDIFPDAKKVGILFCSAEPNSLYQANVIGEILTGMGLEVTNFTFADSNDVASVAANACAECDVLYTPTDNVVATCSETIHNIALPAGVPIVAGEAGQSCGAVTLSIDYFDIGYIAGEMAAEILTEGKNPGDMDIRFAPEVTKMFNPAVCEALGITVPEDYVAIG